MTHLLEKETPFVFSKECIEAFNILKKKLTEAPILVAPDWDLPFEIMCDASDYAVGAVLGQRKTKHFQPIHYASKTMTDAQAHYTTTEKELLAVVYAFEKFRAYEGLAAGVEGPGMDDESHGIDDEIHGLDKEVNSVREYGFGIEGRGGRLYWGLAQEGSGSTLESERPEREFGTHLGQPSITITCDRPGGWGINHDHAYDWRRGGFQPDLFESPEYEHERVAVTFGAIWRPVLAVESWAGQTDAQRAALWHAISDMQGENRDLRLQLAEERHA
ncbi:reverse transcriptase domain-containing protein [Tanacetum coccineum]